MYEKCNFYEASNMKNGHFILRRNKIDNFGWYENINESFVALDDLYSCGIGCQLINLFGFIRTRFKF